jgi:hypothetical protein
MPCPKDFSRTNLIGRAYAGSQRQIQTYVNERTEAFNSAVAQSLSHYNLNEKDIHWVSPLAADEYSEYRDSECLERVGLESLAPQLLEFWPRLGPCWDALARIGSGCLLIEAKSHVPEIYGGGCGASLQSTQKIQKAFDATKAWLGVSPDIDWTGPLYQSANRYAHLYFLTEIAKIRAFLVNVYLIDDPRPRARTTREDWDAAIERVDQELGLTCKVPHSAAVFLTAQ